MTAKGVMDVHPARPFYIIIANFGNTDVHLPKLQNVDKVANAPEQIVHIKDERLSYPSDTKATKRDSPVIAVHYKPTAGRLHQMAEHDAVKERDEETIEKTGAMTYSYSPSSNSTTQSF